MKVIEIEQGSDDWKQYREGKLTGTKIGKIFAKSRNSEEMFDTTKPLLGFYELLAERLTDSDDLGSSIERGHELEAEALEKASEELGINFVHGIFLLTFVVACVIILIEEVIRVIKKGGKK